MQGPGLGILSSHYDSADVAFVYNLRVKKFPPRACVFGVPLLSNVRILTARVRDAHFDRARPVAGPSLKPRAPNVRPTRGARRGDCRVGRRAPPVSIGCRHQPTPPLTDTQHCSLSTPTPFHQRSDAAAKSQRGRLTITGKLSYLWSRCCVVCVRVITITSFASRTLISVAI